MDLCAEGRARIERVLNGIPATESQLNAVLLGSLAHLITELGEYGRAFDLATSALSHARASGDDGTLALTLYHHANKASAVRQLAVAEASLAEAESFVGISVALELNLLRARAFHDGICGDFDSAVRSGERFMAKCRSIGDAGGWRQGAYILSKYEYARGEMQRGIKVTRENILASRNAGDTWILPLALLVLGVCLASENDLGGAAAAVDEVLEMEILNPMVATVALEHRALVCAMGGDLRRAAVLEGAAARRQGTERGVYEATAMDRLRVLLRDGLEPSERERLAADGAELTVEAAVALALGDS